MVISTGMVGNGVIEIPEAIRTQLVDHALAQLPNEACGFLAGHGSRVERFLPVRNHDASEWTYFMDPRDQKRAQDEMDASGLDLLAVFHSHPRTAAFPSPTDAQQAYWPARDPTSGEHMMIFPEARYVILSLRDRQRPELRAFRIVTEEEVRFL
jgi:proteasome lid subunit RPN8/RPN11